ncbi:hypothetical protein FCI23_22365 [Actinacidiphila oryziradicis]|uniref:Uncharacterized protein n=2 Tax=Actinacidiphila oryziradicis TaxID=2571141 RepID=A0A4U0SN24_9ACTN|nr:hypothetical protein FCI23_22365 [Actinacidiphila oryziradicis]
MGIGYKTSWLAVQDAAPEEVADALGLQHRHIMDWVGGTSAAYRQGVFVARPVPDWTIAHSRIHLPSGSDATDPRFPAWLQTLSTQLGDVQYFATDRIGEYHAWAKVESGELTRAYCYSGMQGDVPLHLGEPTEVERELGVGGHWLEDGWQEWQEPEWDAWLAAMPREGDVMRIAERWGICPLDIPDDSVDPPGIYGFPSGVEPCCRSRL